MLEPGQQAMTWLQAIAKCSREGPGVTRLPFTEDHDQALDLLRGWMEQAGLEVHLDAAGTLIGRREGSKTTRTLILGSHQDSVPQGGCFDGSMGVVLPLVVLAGLKDEPLPYSVEVLAFADEEGVRFPTALMGPRALAGTFDMATLDVADSQGTTLAGAMAAFGLQPDQIPALKRVAADIIGYVETHIEQGPVLEDKQIPVGIVTAISGIERWNVILSGTAAHAGTTPMDLRRDALAAAAEIVLEVERLARQTDGLVGVVGHLNVIPNAVNAVPGEVRLQVEVRSGDDQARITAGDRIADFVAGTASRRKLQAVAEKTYNQETVHCDPMLSQSLSEAVNLAGYTAPAHMVSGATHDASAMAAVTPIAMLFVRCKDGVSHHPDEAVTTADLECAALVLREFLLRLQVSG